MSYIDAWIAQHLDPIRPDLIILSCWLLQDDDAKADETLDPYVLELANEILDLLVTLIRRRGRRLEEVGNPRWWLKHQCVRICRGMSAGAGDSTIREPFDTQT
ncbi:MAG: hypothetical protein K2W96_23000 [Gemmataceae bacterium]|nr:hypothetical protein [Gemmataceae bacterium]